MDTAAEIDELILTTVRRADALALLEGDSLARRDFEDGLKVSRTTAHRVLHELEEAGLIRQRSGEYSLSELGHIALRQVRQFRRRLGTAKDLSLVLERVPDTEGIDLDAFSDATVTQSAPGDPYRPLQRACDLLLETSTLRLASLSVPSETFLQRLVEATQSGLDACLIYPQEVLDTIVDRYPGTVDELVAAGASITVSEEIPYGLFVFDGRVGVGRYDEGTGLLSIVVDTDHGDAIEWGCDRFAAYWATADEPSFPTEGFEWPSSSWRTNIE